VSEPIWDRFLTEQDKQVFAASGYANAGGFGKRPAPERAAGMPSATQAMNVGLAWSEFQGTVLPVLTEAVLEIDSRVRS
jgi:hypothetical protein